MVRIAQWCVAVPETLHDTFIFLRISMNLCFWSFFILHFQQIDRISTKIRGGGMYRLSTFIFTFITFHLSPTILKHTKTVFLVSKLERFFPHLSSSFRRFRTGGSLESEIASEQARSAALRDAFEGRRARYATAEEAARNAEFGGSGPGEEQHGLQEIISHIIYIYKHIETYILYVCIECKLFI